LVAPQKPSPFHEFTGLSVSIGATTVGDTDGESVGGNVGLNDGDRVACPSDPHESPFQTGEEVGFSEIAAVSVGEVVGMWPSPFQTGEEVGFSEIAAVSVGEVVGMWPSPFHLAIEGLRDGLRVGSGVTIATIGAEVGFLEIDP